MLPCVQRVNNSNEIVDDNLTSHQVSRRPYGTQVKHGVHESGTEAQFDSMCSLTLCPEVYFYIMKFHIHFKMPNLSNLKTANKRKHANNKAVMGKAVRV